MYFLGGNKPATALISVKRVPLESNGILLSATCAAAYAGARVLEIALTGSSALRRRQSRAREREEREGRLKEGDKQMAAAAVVGDASEVTRAR